MIRSRTNGFKLVVGFGRSIRFGKTLSFSSIQELDFPSQTLIGGQHGKNVSLIGVSPNSFDLMNTASGKTVPKVFKIGNVVVALPLATGL